MYREDELDIGMLAIVGNGPGAAGHGAEIDACDDVIRINEWWTRGAAGTGRKTTILVGYNERLEIPDRDLLPYCEFWINNADPKFQHTDVAYIIQRADGRPVRLIAMELQIAIDRAIRAEADSEEVGGSAGIKALAMALAAGRWERILLFGFDSMSSAAADIIDGHGRVATCDDPTHDFAAEKRLIARVVDTGYWLGEKGP